MPVTVRGILRALGLGFPVAMQSKMEEEDKNCCLGVFSATPEPLSLEESRIDASW